MGGVRFGSEANMPKYLLLAVIAMGLCATSTV